MGVFHVFKIVQMLPYRPMYHISEQVTTNMAGPRKILALHQDRLQKQLQH